MTIIKRIYALRYYWKNIFLFSLTALLVGATIFKTIHLGEIFIPGIVLSAVITVISGFSFVETRSNQEAVVPGFSFRQDENRLKTMAAQIVAGTGGQFVRVEGSTEQEGRNVKVKRFRFVANQNSREDKEYILTILYVYLSGKLTYLKENGVKEMTFADFIKADELLQQLFRLLFDSIDIVDDDRYYASIQIVDTVIGSILNGRSAEIDNVYSCLKENRDIVIMY